MPLKSARLRSSLLCVNFLLLLVVTSFSFSQEKDEYVHNQYSKTTINTEDGLPHNSISAIVQDSQGFIWISSIFGGLARYDGYDIKVYKHDLSDDTSISSNDIWFLFIDQEEVLWVGTTNNGLNKYNPKTDSFTRYQFDKNNANSIPSNDIKCMYQTKDGTLWVGTTNGLSRFNPETDSFYNYNHNPENQHSKSNFDVRDIFEDEETGLMLLAMRHSGLTIFDSNSENFTYLRHDSKNNKSISTNAADVIHKDKRGNIWIGTRNGLNKFDIHNKTFTVHYKFPLDEEGNPSNSNAAFTITEVEDNLLVGGYNGLHLFSTKNATFYDAEYDVLGFKPEEAKDIFSLFKDEDNNIWVGTSNAGVYKIRQESETFVSYNHNPNNLNSLSNDHVNFLLADNNNGLWIATQNGLNFFDGENFTHYFHNPNDVNSLSSNKIYSLAQDDDDVIWIATLGGGINSFNPKTKTFKRHPEIIKNEDIKASILMSLIIFKGNQLLIHSEGHGLILFDKATNTSRLFTTSDSSGLPSLYTPNPIYDKENDVVWVPTTEGLSKMDLETYTFKTYTLAPNDTQKNWLEYVHKDSNNQLWVASHLGISCFDIAQEKFIKHYTTLDGLAGNNPLTITEDNNGHLWIATRGDGISRFDPISETFTNYGKLDGLGSNHFARSIVTTNDDRFYLSTIKGFSAFYPEKVEQNKYIPPVVFTDFKLYNVSPKLGSEKGQIPLPINLTDELVLEHDQTVFTIEFSALNYTIPEKNQYAYKMEGFNEEWITTTSDRRYATYTNLDPGSYTFRVKASNNDAVWNEEGQSVKIKILPAWWQTWWAYSLYAFVVVFSIWLYNNRKLARLRKQKLILESEVKKRTTEILQQKKEIEDTLEELEHKKEQLIQAEKMAAIGVLSAGIAHEINNPVNFISVGTQSLHRDMKDLMIILKQLDGISLEDNLNEIQEKLKTIDKLKEDLYYKDIVNSMPEIIDGISVGVKRTTEIVNGLLLYSRKDSDQFEEGNIHEIIDTALLLLRKSYKYNVEIIKNYDTSIKNGNFLVGELNQLFVNIIDNAIFACGDEDGIITITTKLIGETIMISVRDTGIGIPEDVKVKIFDPFFTTKKVGEGTGLGLSICHGIAEKHKGNIIVESELGKGTEFIISLSSILSND